MRTHNKLIIDDIGCVIQNHFFQRRRVHSVFQNVFEGNRSEFLEFNGEKRKTW